MTTIEGTVADRTELIADQVRAVDVGRVAARLVRAFAHAVVFVLWALGWVLGQLVNGVVYVAVAVRQGWRDARPRRPVDQPARPTPDRTVR